MLSETQIGVAQRAADRISVKLTAAKRSGKAIDMEEEFRLLTLQVIGEAVLSLPAAECDRVSLACPVHPSNCEPPLPGMQALVLSSVSPWDAGISAVVSACDG